MEMTGERDRWLTLETLDQMPLTNWGALTWVLEIRFYSIISQDIYL